MAHERFSSKLAAANWRGMHIKVDISWTPTEVEALSRIPPSPWRFGVAAGGKY